MKLKWSQIIANRKGSLAFQLFSYMSAVVLSILLLQGITEQALIRTVLVLPDSVKTELRDLASQANVMIGEGDMNELADWANAQPYYLFVLDKNNQPITHRKMHPHFAFKLKFLRQLDQMMGDRVTKPLIGQSLDGGHTLVVQLPSQMHPAHRFISYLAISKFIIAFFILALFSLILARKLQQPLDRLREASHRVARGDFKVKVVAELKSNTREFNELAEDFDQMSIQIHSLAEKQKRLIRDVSHELRTPLARQNLALHLLKHKVPEKDRELVERVEREVEEMDSLVAEILTFSQLENSRYEVNLKPVCLESYVGSQVRQSQFALGAEQYLNFVPSHLDQQVLADERLVVRCVRNLITNATKYAGEKATIEVLIYGLRQEEQEYSVVAVQDDGKGIPVNRLGEIFQPFTRLESARDKKSGGYGLGLAIVKEAMHLMQGRVQASNRSIGGLRIELLFPIQKTRQ
ncbi:putative two-component system sensor kinase [Vibrio ichthyoenteri ATCC 700023]|uniref:histidine kinase n=1 Tax=Vibrio ichthyoenteri ATCC 700023 TaxID=870968 RepID=F9RYI6_9VIBR|nr:sensor histidine kinase [Vibrio ichthyoenteri]EGU46403.1 putative two-component system sensor kinase [Vibrio ichthyoenteri ATCC 700023]